MNLARAFYLSVLERTEVECPAVQDAIDALATEFGRGRRNLLDVLERSSNAQICDLILVAWARAPLKLATGRDRDTWLRYFSRAVAS